MLKTQKERKEKINTDFAKDFLEIIKKKHEPYKNKKGKEIQWICRSCGRKASGGRQFDVSCWHIDVCDMCNKVKEVTQKRDFFL